MRAVKYNIEGKGKVNKTDKKMTEEALEISNKNVKWMIKGIH